MDRRVLIVGAGNWMCGDDGAGIIVATHLGRRLGEGARVAFDARALWDVVDGTQRAGLLVIVDAALATKRLPAGSWCRIDYPDGARALEEHTFRNTHSLNLRSMLQLADKLGTLPPNVWIYGLAGADYTFGASLSPAVAAGADKLEERIAGDIAVWLERGVCTSSRSPSPFATSPSRRPADTGAAALRPSNAASA